jgi:tetratricopeptide (TPR) repeat protein
MQSVPCVKGRANVVRFDHERGRSEESKVLFTTTFKISEEYLEYDEELMLEIHTSLGCIATEINDAGTCFKHYTKLLEMTKEKYANPKEDAEFDALMVANNEMGIAHMMMDHVRESSPLFERAQKMAITQLHSSETAVSIYFLSSANLGLALWLDGQYPIALKTLTEAWKYHESLVEKGQDTGFAYVI